MPAVKSARDRKPYSRPVLPAPSDEQVAWIVARDRFGAVIDDYLTTKPSREMRAAVEQVESSLALGDRAAGLL
jgi:hypothetical protein